MATTMANKAMAVALKQAIVLALLGPFSHVSAAPTERTTSNTEEQNPCRLWLAPSYLSTDDAPRFGLYAGVQGFADDEIIPSHEIAIPMFDFQQSPSAEHHRASVNFLESIMWVSDYAGSKFEANYSTSVYIPGIGIWANHHSGMSNVDWLQSSILLRELDEVAQSQRGLAHPSRGAITPYYNATLRATREIPPGMELYGNLGSSNGEPVDDIFQEKVTRWDFDKADQLLDKILAFMEKYDGHMDDALKDKVLDFMLEHILEGANRKRSKVIRSLIPARIDKLQQVNDAGGTWAFRNRSILKSPEWFEKHGVCVDKLRPGSSTIPDAGRGAFANRAIKQGDSISPVPMIPILNERALDLYTESILVKNDDGEESTLDPEAAPTGRHMLLNYCFGHSESTLLLLPSAPIVNLINHAPERSQVNAFLQWSTHESVFNDHSMHDELLENWELKDGVPPPVVMELVASRDIQKDEEIFIDYGRGWTEAWNAYKQAFDIGFRENNKWPLRAADVLPLYKDKPFPINISEGQVPYPNGVVTACFMDKADDLPDGFPKRNANGLDIMRWLSPKTREDVMGQHLHICDLTGRESVTLDDGSLSYNYTVLTKSGDMMLEAQQVPHDAIILVNRPYSSDVHTLNSFRRWIDIDDQRFPQAWRNLRSAN